MADSVGVEDTSHCGSETINASTKAMESSPVISYKGKLPGIIDNFHYSFVSVEESATAGTKIILAKCLLCSVSEQGNTIKGDNKTEANYTRHLKVHYLFMF